MGNSRVDVAKITYIGLFTSIVAVLQYMGGFIKIGGLFSVSLVLIPIVIGSALCGVKAGAWLGFVFSVMVFITGDAALFLTLNIPGTIITVIAKGTLAGLAAGAVYKLCERFNRTVAVVAAAVVCPVVNTGVFLLGCSLFFMEALSECASASGMPIGTYMIVGLVGLNFVFELIFNVVLAPVAVRLIDVKDPVRRPKADTASEEAAKAAVKEITEAATDKIANDYIEEITEESVEDANETVMEESVENAAETVTVVSVKDASEATMATE